MTPSPNADSPFLAGPPVEPAPFDAFYRGHAPAVLSFLLPWTADGDLADDICAEVFAVAAWLRARGEAPHDLSFGGQREWLLALAEEALRAGGLGPASPAARLRRVARPARRACRRPC